MPVSALGGDELRRLYGPWAGRTPRDAAELFGDFPGRWWVAGGWAIEAFTGVERPHSDLDVEVPRSELPALRRYLAGRLDAWTASDGALTPLLPGDDPDAPADDVLPSGCGQLWTRRSGTDPWEYDILLGATDGDQWQFTRDHRITRPLDDVVWVRDGVRYLRPEVQLLLKARGRRPKDQRDFEVTLPLLDAGSRRWLLGSLQIAHPDHPWTRSLGQTNT